MASSKIQPGRATISMKLRTSTIAINLAGGSLSERLALVIYRFVSGTGTRGERDVLLERQRQFAPGDSEIFRGENHTLEDDDKQTDMQLAYAADCYIRSAVLAGNAQVLQVPFVWPWAAGAYKPKDQRSDLVRAAALLIAEIDRIDRMSDAIKEANQS